ncbi:hypothetical protein [Cyclobacterium jeungdonense]|uniref:6-bladed beta-propeller n=1 Tax=Cyclobacterium jeungdonense TaxID=708087 RepID=A0ABT8C7M7_9BACT|nr:hypothetical protein [Cyclobacterium jeungdonense]MDN3688064.1 hypothetical protein [Cyclobacterium jeungdonense]
MMRNKLTLLAGFFALGFACSPASDENEIEEIVVFDEKDLPDPIALVGKKYNFPNITNPRNILCLGDYLVVSERSNGDLLHILDIQSEKYIRSTGKERTYGLHLGKSFRNISDPDKLNRVFVFDYHGKILNQYSLDYPLTGFTVDEDNGIIYGLTVDEEPNVVAFALPEGSLLTE